MSSKYDVSGKYSNGAKQEKSTSQRLATELEILPPSTSAEWKPRKANDIVVDDPRVRVHRSFFGTPYTVPGAFEADLREATSTNNAATGLLKAKVEKEEAFQDYERVLARRELMPLLIENDQLTVGQQVAGARATMRRTCHEMDQQEHKIEQEIVDAKRIADASTTEYEIQRARKRQKLAEANAAAACAEEVAKLKAQAEMARLRTEIAKAERENSVPSGDEGEDEPAAFREAMARQRKRSDINVRPQSARRPSSRRSAETRPCSMMTP